MNLTISMNISSDDVVDLVFGIDIAPFTGECHKGIVSLNVFFLAISLLIGFLTGFLTGFSDE